MASKEESLHSLDESLFIRAAIGAIPTSGMVVTFLVSREMDRLARVPARRRRQRPGWSCCLVDSVGQTTRERRPDVRVLEHNLDVGGVVLLTRPGQGRVKLRVRGDPGREPVLAPQCLG